MDDKTRFTLDRRTVLGTTGLAVLGAITGSASADEHNDQGDGYHVDDVIADWDEEPRQIAEETMETYGEPDEVVPSRLFWHHEGDAPWKRTELFRDPIPHEFPQPHNDYLEQFIDYHVPPTLYDEVARYDGSVMLERTKGEVSARCDVEAMNFLAVNLTHELVHDDAMGVEDARRAYAEDAMAFMEDEEPPRTQGVQFELPPGDQRDPDVAIIENGEIVMREDLGPEDDQEKNDADEDR